MVPLPTCDDIVIIKHHITPPDQQLFWCQRLSNVVALMVHVVPTWGGIQLVPQDCAQSLLAGNRRGAQSLRAQQLPLPQRLLQVTLYRVLNVAGWYAQCVLPASAKICVSQLP